MHILYLSFGTAAILSAMRSFNSSLSSVRNSMATFSCLLSMEMGIRANMLLISRGAGIAPLSRFISPHSPSLMK